MKKRPFGSRMARGRPRKAGAGGRHGLIGGAGASPVPEELHAHDRGDHQHLVDVLLHLDLVAVLAVKLKVGVLRDDHGAALAVDGHSVVRVEIAGVGISAAKHLEDLAPRAALPISKGDCVLPRGPLARLGHPRPRVELGVALEQFGLRLTRLVRFGRVDEHVGQREGLASCIHLRETCGEDELADDGAIHCAHLPPVLVDRDLQEVRAVLLLHGVVCRWLAEAQILLEAERRTVLRIHALSFDDLEAMGRVVRLCKARSPIRLAAGHGSACHRRGSTGA
mmetsp:Transcript_55522/g.172005  ORF Transcript_55522/g.172005 Transcript_55522/m.172005 type:complete len:280 (+) Transcript_55522:14-853(+)